MGTTQTLRKAYGALKDHATVGLAHVNSDFKDVDVAIVKATNHVETPPKESHIKKILAATSGIRTRSDVAYCIDALARRLAKTHNWTVALKTLIVIHRILREGDPIFREELLNLQQRGLILQMSNFKDDSSPIAWVCSSWVRSYALFLEERFECFKVLKYDIETEHIPRPSEGQDKLCGGRTRDLSSEDLLEQLPALQQLLYRLTGCRPEEATASNPVIQYALALVAKESFKLYCTINDGIITLVDKFFGMPKHEAMKALDIYKRAGHQALGLSKFYQCCKGLQLARSFQFPALREPPQSFVATMEEYVNEAPRVVSVPIVAMDYPESVLPPCEEMKITSPEQNPPPEETVVSVSPATNLSADDLPTKDFDTTDWELDLLSTPSSSHETQLAGGLDSLTLNTFYEEEEDACRGSQIDVYGARSPNPFEISHHNIPNPFASFEQASIPRPNSNRSICFSPLKTHSAMLILLRPYTPRSTTRFGTRELYERFQISIWVLGSCKLVQIELGHGKSNWDM